MNNVFTATRLKALKDYRLLDILPEKKYDDIARLAAQLCDAPISLISLLDDKREFFIAHYGWEINEVSLEHSFYPPNGQDKNNILEIEDTRENKQFKDHPLVAGPPNIIHYTGLALVTDSGIRLGTICVIDRKARKLNEEQIRSLEVLGHQLIQLFELHRARTQEKQAKENPDFRSAQLTDKKNDEIQFKSLVDNIPGGVIRYKQEADGRHNLLFVSKGAEEMWGISREEAIENKQLVWDRYPEDGLPAHFRSIDIDSNRDRNWYHEWHYEHPDGTICLHKIAGNPTPHKDGSIIWDIIILDVTEQKKTEEELSLTLHQLKERAKEKDCLSNITHLANRDLEVEDLLGKAVELIPEGWQFPEICTAAIEYNNVTYKSDGYKITPWTQTVQKATFEGKPLKIIVAYQKKQTKAWEGPFLKEERQLIDALADSLILSIDKKVAFKKHQLILHSTEEGIYGIDVNGYCTFINPAAAEMIGYSFKECLSKNMHDLIHYKKKDGSEYKESECPIYRTRDSHEGCRVEDELFMRKDGSSFPVRYSSTPIIENGEIKGAVVVFNDITERVDTDRKLKRSEQLFKSLVQEGSDLVAIVNAEGCFNYVSPLYTHYFNIPVSELQGRNAFDLVHPDDVEKLKEEFEELKIQKRKKSSPYRVMHKSKSWRWVQSLGTDLQDDDAIQGIVINTTDISEFIETQQKLEASEARYRGFYESQTNFVIRTDMEGNYTYVNKKFMEDFGWLYPDGEVMGINSMPSIKEYHHPKVMETVQKCIASPGMVIKVEVDKPTHDDGVVTTLWDFVCLLDAEGHPSEMQCMGIDITERIHFEKALKDHNERFELIMQASSECICDLNLKTGELYLSDGFARNFGMEIKSLEENKAQINSLIHPEDKAEVISSFHQAIYESEKDAWSMEYRLQKSDGEYAVIKDKAIIMRNEAGEAYRALGVIKDISEKYFYKELESLEKEVMEMAIQPDVTLKVVLDTYLMRLEGLFPGLKASVLKIEDDKLWTLSAPSLPAAFTEKLEGLSIGPKAGSCGTAAYTKKKVIVKNVFDDERWASYTDLPEEFGFKSCWSQPIFNAEGAVIASFANYYNSVKTPDQKEEHAIERAQQLISILMAKYRYLDNIRKSNERYTLVNKATKDAIYDWDVQSDIFYWGESFTRLFGHPANYANFNLNEWAKLVHPDDIKEAKQSLFNFFGEKTQSRWTFDYRFQRKDGSYAHVNEIGYLIRDDKGEPSRMVGVLRDMSDVKKLEELLDSATKLARIGAWDLDLVNDNLYWSPITRKIHEVDENFQPGLETAIQFYRKGDQEIVSEYVSGAIEKGTPFDFELPIITAKGNKRWIRTIGQPEFAGGKCIRVYGSFQDIHQRKSAELALQKTLGEKNTILESIGDAFFAMDNKWIVQYWNNSAEQVMGISRAEVIGKNLWQVFPEAKKLDFYEKYHEAREKQLPIQFEEFYPPVNIWLEVNVYPSAEGMSVFFRNITERKRSEKKIRETNERFEKVTQATNDAIWDYDLVNDTLFWAKGFFTLFGHEPDELNVSIELFVSLIHPEDRTDFTHKMKDFIKDPKGINWFAEYRFQRNDGTYATVIDRAIFIRNEKGEAIRAVGAMTDISYRKKNEEALKKLNEELEKRALELAITNKELEQFAYVASHDLQEPLRMVSSFLSQLDKKYGEVLDDKARQYIHFAVDGAHRMRQIILDLLEYSQVGKIEEEKKEISLNDILDQVRKLLHRKVEKTNARIYYDDLPVIKSYYTPLIQIFQNLISNAIKYTKKGETPEIYINAQKQENEWLVSIRDNGIGIDPEYFEKIFILFQRLHVKEKYGGTGIGLAIVKKNIENIGGRIWLESEKGKGSTFFLAIPHNNN